jgi:iron complex transport system substrate-binding protein
MFRLTLALLLSLSGFNLSADSRWVALSPHLTELIFAVGAGDELVGVVEYSDYPQQALSIPRIGNSQQINLESLLALNPTAVFAWESGNGGEVIQQIKNLGMTVYGFEPHTLDDVAESLRELGRLTGHEQAGSEQASSFAQRLERLRRRYSDQPRVSVFFQLSDEPYMTINGDHVITDVIALCGGINIFADAALLVPKISLESILERQPDVIVTALTDPADSSWKLGWSQWAEVPAVSRNRLYAIHPDLLYRHTPRILDGAEQLCQSLDQARSHNY